MEKKYAKRLLKLADFLEKLPRKRFDYSEWVGEGNGAKEIKPDLSCGTKACALGWSCAMPEFRRLGARIEIRTHESFRYFTAAYLRFGKEEGPYGVAEKLFGMTSEEVDEVFVPDSPSGSPAIDATPKQVAKHIRRFVEGKLNLCTG